MNTDSELLGKDIANIVLTHDLASIVVENVHTLDWHGHSYIRYLTHGGRGDRLNTVVLLGIRRDIHGLRDGWENAVVVTYAEVLDGLRELIGDLPGWRREHKQQLFFLDQCQRSAGLPCGRSRDLPVRGQFISLCAVS